MIPIYIYAGFERYLLVRAGTAAARSGKQTDPARTKAVFEAALRRGDPQLIRELGRILNMRGEDPRVIAQRALARLTATGTLGGELVLLHAPRPTAQVHSRTQLEEPEAPPPEEIEEKEEEQPKAKTTIRVSLFFDGTANNRANTRERLAAEAAGRAFSKTGSYENDESNVSRLETLCQGDPNFEHSFSVYVEGIGTTNHQGDTTVGLALGTGSTGVPAKVQAGVNEVLRRIRQLGIPSGTIIERFHVDTFGFSRGAAAARHCVHFCLNGDTPLEPRIERLGYPVDLLEVNFVGLFDTVASYGVQHTNDTRDLDLDAISAAKKVVQLAAAEEHRKNFRLTNIASAVKKGVGKEIFLPGVHSDVGGGYTDNAAEVDLQILDFDVMWSDDALKRRFERERAWLIDSGWYLPNEIADVSFWNELKVTRRGIRNHYNRIPLKHMAEFAMQTGLIFDPTIERFPIPPALATIQALVAAHVAGGASTAEFWINMRTPDYRKLRHDYLHFSAYYGNVSNAPQFTNDDPLNGQRQRIVQVG
jgi:hypothetical protein